MKKEQILELMNALPPDLVEEADIQTPVKRRFSKGVRGALIAACLCLALVGTAAAIRFSGVGIVKGEDGTIYLQGGMAYYPHDDLSDQLKELEGMRETKNGRFIRRFGSWEELESFIGFDLMENPVLDASPATNFSHTFDGVNGKYLVITGPALTNILIYGSYEVGDTDITVQAELFTDRKADQSEDWDERFYGFRYPEGTKMEQGVYTAPSGLAAQLLEVKRGGDRDVARAVFSLNGIPFIVKVDGNGAEARAVLLQVLDGFEI